MVYLVGWGMNFLVKIFMLYCKECYFDYLLGERFYRFLNFDYYVKDMDVLLDDFFGWDENF